MFLYIIRTIWSLSVSCGVFTIISSLLCVLALRLYCMDGGSGKYGTCRHTERQIITVMIYVYADSTSHRDSSATAVTLSAVETQGPGGVKSLLDVVVVDSGSSAVVAVAPARSPLARLRTRKVQWQECDKCARSDHSSDEASLLIMMMIIIIIII